MLVPSGLKVFVAQGGLDMRKSFAGIVSLIQSEFKKPANSGHLFVFFNRRADKVKLFYWDRNGFVQWYKQLEEGQFRPPRLTQKLYELSVSDLTLLLEGIDLSHRQRLHAY